MTSRNIAARRGAVLLLGALAALTCAAQEKIVLDGSTGMIPLARVIAQAYQRQAPAAQVHIGEGLGTTARMKAVAEAGSTWRWRATESTRLNSRRTGFVRSRSPKAIVFAVNASVPLAEATEQQVCDLFSGKAVNWSAMKGPDVPVVVLTRPPAEVDPGVIRAKVACFKDL